MICMDVCMVSESKECGESFAHPSESGFFMEGFFPCGRGVVQGAGSSVLPTLRHLEALNTPDIKCPAGHCASLQRLHKKWAID